MIAGALILFAVAALLGGVLAGRVLRRRPVPAAAAFTHLGIAAAGLVVLSAGVASGGDSMILNDALALFALTAAGGLLLLGFRLGRRPIPAPFVVLHAVLAVISVLVLAAAWYGT